MISREEVESVLDYDPDTGLFRWRVNRRRARRGNVAGWLNVEGYREICVFGKLCRAHRLAWLLMYGEMPRGGIDHIDGARDNNSIANLRLASQQQNMANRKLTANRRRGTLKGCYLNEKWGRWISQITVGGKWLYLGNYSTEMEAHEAYMKAAKDYFGEFARSG